MSTATPLGALVGKLQPQDYASGFRLLASGSAALDARLALIARATTTLDLQYYVFDVDATGRRIAGALVEAARRGVRVRLLLDDWHAVGSEAMLTALGEEKNIEVRLFSPVAPGLRGPLGRWVALASRFGTLNARMHNKLFIVDGAIAIVGGRNIGDAYFEVGSSFFIDIDVLAAGAVATDLADLFDVYWNSPLAYPAPDILGQGSENAQAGRAFSERLTVERGLPATSADPAGATTFLALGRELDHGELDLRWGTAIAFADAPSKMGRLGNVIGGSTDDARNVRELIWRHMSRATSEYLILTPYLIPGREGMEQVRRNAGRGVKITIVTNSLASTDEALVHAAYRRYREDMLDARVDLREFSAAAAGAWGQDVRVPGTTATLHAKGVVFDRKAVFLGSLNFDPRSLATNTEIGVFIESKGLAQDILAVIEQAVQTSTYSVVRTPQGGVGWRRSAGGALLTVEPEASWARRAWIDLVSPLLPESLF